MTFSMDGDNNKPFVTIVVLVSGVAGGLVVVITFILLCKYCFKKKTTDFLDEGRSHAIPSSGSLSSVEEKKGYSKFTNGPSQLPSPLPLADDLEKYLPQPPSEEQSFMGTNSLVDCERVQPQENSATQSSGQLKSERKSREELDYERLFPKCNAGSPQSKSVAGEPHLRQEENQQHQRQQQQLQQQQQQQHHPQLQQQHEYHQQAQEQEHQQQHQQLQQQQSMPSSSQGQAQSYRLEKSASVEVTSNSVAAVSSNRLKMTPQISTVIEPPSDDDTMTETIIHTMPTPSSLTAKLAPGLQPKAASSSRSPNVTRLSVARRPSHEKRRSLGPIGYLPESGQTVLEKGPPPDRRQSLNVNMLTTATVNNDMQRPASQRALYTRDHEQSRSYALGEYNSATRRGSVIVNYFSRSDVGPEYRRRSFVRQDPIFPYKCTNDTTHGGTTLVVPGHVAAPIVSHPSDPPSISGSANPVIGAYLVSNNQAHLNYPTSQKMTQQENHLYLMQQFQQLHQNKQPQQQQQLQQYHQQQNKEQQLQLQTADSKGARDHSPRTSAVDSGTNQIVSTENYAVRGAQHRSDLRPPIIANRHARSLDITAGFDPLITKVGSEDTKQSVLQGRQVRSLQTSDTIADTNQATEGRKWLQHPSFTRDYSFNDRERSGSVDRRPPRPTESMARQPSEECEVGDDAATQQIRAECKLLWRLRSTFDDDDHSEGAPTQFPTVTTASPQPDHPKQAGTQHSWPKVEDGESGTSYTTSFESNTEPVPHVEEPNRQRRRSSTYLEPPAHIGSEQRRQKYRNLLARRQLNAQGSFGNNLSLDDGSFERSFDESFERSFESTGVDSDSSRPDFFLTSFESYASNVSNVSNASFVSNCGEQSDSTNDSSGKKRLSEIKHDSGYKSQSTENHPFSSVDRARVALSQPTTPVANKQNYRFPHSIDVGGYGSQLDVSKVYPRLPSPAPHSQLPITPIDPSLRVAVYAPVIESAGVDGPGNTGPRVVYLPSTNYFNPHIRVDPERDLKSGYNIVDVDGGGVSPRILQQQQQRQQQFTSATTGSAVGGLSVDSTYIVAQRFPGGSAGEAYSKPFGAFSPVMGKKMLPWSVSADTRLPRQDYVVDLDDSTGIDTRFLGSCDAAPSNLNIVSDPGKLSRDYSIDSKTDMIFREFNRLDPFYDSNQTASTRSGDDHSGVRMPGVGEYVISDNRYHPFDSADSGKMMLVRQGTSPFATGAPRRQLPSPNGSPSGLLPAYYNSREQSVITPGRKRSITEATFRHTIESVPGPGYSGSKDQWMMYHPYNFPNLESQRNFGGEGAAGNAVSTSVYGSPREEQGTPQSRYNNSPFQMSPIYAMKDAQGRNRLVDPRRNSRGACLPTIPIIKLPSDDDLH